MKKIFLLFFALFFVISISAFAADKASESDAPAVKKSSKNKKADQHKKHYFGEVIFIDVEGGKITVVGKKSEKTFKADEALLKHIKLNDRVFVRYTKKDKTLVAVSIKSSDEKLHRSGMQMRGEVRSVDASAATITVIGRKGESILTADRKMLEGFSAGDKVYIKYSDDNGKLTATSIQHLKKIKPRSADEPKAEDKK